MPLPRAEFSRRAARWLLSVSLLALAPKCGLCMLAYVGLGATLGAGGVELCGAVAETPVAWATALMWLGGVAGGGAVVAWVVWTRQPG